MFEALSERLGAAVSRIRGKNRLSEENIADALKEVRTALLEADVNLAVIKAFLDSVKERVIGEEPSAGLTAGQYFIKVVSDELGQMMGGQHEGLALSGRPPAVVLLVGLQGSGKTSTVGKLAKLLQDEGKKPYLVPADVYRPAAIEQLAVLAKQLGVQNYPSTVGMDPVAISRDGVEAGRKAGADVVLIDTAGRIHLDDALMVELEQIKKAVSPAEILFVADGMTGQDAVNTAKAFHDRLELTGHVLTKMDGDARGGAALSIRAVTKKPIKFMAVGEKLENLERFHPERVAGRILGMGDLVGLIEKAQQAFSEQDALAMQAKLAKNEFSLDDFLQQLKTMRQMGSMKEILAMMPGMGQALKSAKLDDKQLVQAEAIISSMTRLERANHQMINMSRRTRIAKGSGTRSSDVNRLLKQFTQMQKMMKKVGRMGNPMGMAKSLFPGQGGGLFN